MKYNVFISSNSEDYSLSEGVYDFLHHNGLSVFLASKELEQIGESQYRNAIDAALDAATHMIVVASSIEHIHSKWVFYEWSIFSNDINSGYRDGNLITILGPNVQLKDLPAGLRHQQSFSIHSYKSAILGYLKKKEDTIPSSPVFLKLVSDLEIQVYVDGELITHVPKNIATKIEINTGVYNIRFVSLDNPEVFIEESAFWIEDGGVSYSVRLRDAFENYQVNYNQAVDFVKEAKTLLDSDNYNSNNQNKALKLVDKALEICPKCIPALWQKIELSEHAFIREREEMQETLLAEILQIESDNPLALLKKGINRFRKNLLIEAKSIFQKVSELEHTDEWYKALAFNNICACLMKEGNFEEALIPCSQALSLSEKYEILYNKGICHYKIGQIEQAYDCFERIISISEDFSGSYLNIALCCLSMKQPLQAVNSLRKYMELDVFFKYHSEDINDYIKECLFDHIFLLSDLDKSICMGFENSKYLRDAKFAIKIYACFAQALELINKNKEALECYQRILGYDRTNGFAIEGIKNLDNSLSNKVGPMSYDMKKIYDQTIDIYDRKGPTEALDILKNAELRFGEEIHYELLSLIGKLYDRMGEDEKALSYYNRTLSIYRHQPSILLRLAFKYSNNSKNYELSKNVYEEIINDKVSSKDDILFAQNNLGILYCEMGEYEKAGQCYNKVLEIGYSGEIYFNKAYAMLKSANYDEALVYFNKATDEDPELHNVADQFKACCLVGKGNNIAAMKILKQPLSMELDRSVKETVARLNGCRFYYYGIDVSCVSKLIYEFEDNLDFILNLCLCIGSTFENIRNKKKAREAYELMLKLAPDNRFAKVALRRLDTTFWDRLFK